MKLKDIASIRKEVDFVNTLNFTDDEINEHFHKITTIFNELNNCKSNTSNYCINNDGLHEVFYRNNKNKLATTIVKCNKNAVTLDNFWINDNYNNNESEIFNKEFIDTTQQIYTKRNSLVKELNNQIKSNKFSNLYVSGENSLGKTYVFRLFTNSLAKSEKSICFVNIINLFNTFTKYNLFTNQENQFMDQIHKMIDCEILVIDNFGLERFNPYFHINNLYYVVNQRLITKKTTYFISNFTLKKLKLKYINIDNKVIANKLEMQHYNILVNKFISLIEDCVCNKQFAI